MMLQTDHLPVEQQFFDTALAYRYIGRRQIITRHNVMRKAWELSSQYLPVDEEVAPGDSTPQANAIHLAGAVQRW